MSVAPPEKPVAAKHAAPPDRPAVAQSAVPREGAATTSRVVEMLPAATGSAALTSRHAAMVRVPISGPTSTAVSVTTSAKKGKPVTSRNAARWRRAKGGATPGPTAAAAQSIAATAPLTSACVVVCMNPASAISCVHRKTFAIRGTAASQHHALPTGVVRSPTAVAVRSTAHVPATGEPASTAVVSSMVSSVLPVRIMDVPRTAHAPPDSSTPATTSA